MQMSIRKTVHRINTLLPGLSCSVPPQRSRLTRGLFNFMGKMYKLAFGVATESDVGNMKKKKLIERGDTLAATAVADVMRIREGMASFTRLYIHLYSPLGQNKNKTETYKKTSNTHKKLL